MFLSIFLSIVLFVLIVLSRLATVGDAVVVLLATVLVSLLLGSVLFVPITFFDK